MVDLEIREKSLVLEGWVFVFVGAHTFFGKLHAPPGGAYLEPAYVYRVGEEYRVNEKGERVEMRATRELRPPLGFPEVRRLDLDTRTGVGIEELRPETRLLMATLVKKYEEGLRKETLVRV
jgi:hypothetical protein